MIGLHQFIAFVLAVVGLMLLPGPNIALITANSVAHGTRYGLLTVAGTSSAMVVHLAITAIGLTGLLTALGEWFEWIRLAGAAYLVYLGLMIWQSPTVENGGPMPKARAGRVYTRALLVCLTNPGVLLFYGAFFPQFMSAKSDYVSQMAILCSTFLILAILIDSGWALTASWARRFVMSRMRLANRISGGLLITAGVGLAVARSK
jgi:homoserine/homoserine lactone efflux protein